MIKLYTSTHSDMCLNQWIVWLWVMIMTEIHLSVSVNRFLNQWIFSVMIKSRSSLIQLVWVWICGSFSNHQDSLFVHLANWFMIQWIIHSWLRDTPLTGNWFKSVNHSVTQYTSVVFNESVSLQVMTQIHSSPVQKFSVWISELFIFQIKIRSFLSHSKDPCLI